MRLSSGGAFFVTPFSKFGRLHSLSGEWVPTYKRDGGGKRRLRAFMSTGRDVHVTRRWLRGSRFHDAVKGGVTGLEGSAFVNRRSKQHWDPDILFDLTERQTHDQVFFGRTLRSFALPRSGNR